VGKYELRLESPGFSPYANNALVISIGTVVQLTVRECPFVTRAALIVLISAYLVGEEDTRRQNLCNCLEFRLARPERQLDLASLNY
jgi:hypothetical protein